MSFFSNTALSEPISLPIGSIRQEVMVGDNLNSTANTTIITENGIWLEANAVYSQAAYPELYSQLGLLEASVFTRKSVITPPFNDITRYSAINLGYGNSLYILAAGGGYLTSTDLNTWTSRGTATRSAITDVTYGNGVYVLCTAGGGISTITDIRDNEWTARTSGTTSSLLAITYGNGLFIAVGSGGNLRTSPDGITWTARTSGVATEIRDVLYNNGLFIYAGAGGAVRTSTDGITWTARTSGTTSTIFTLAYGNGIYLYGAGGGNLRTSPDGITWTARTSGTTSLISTIAYGNGIYAYGAGDALVFGSPVFYATSTNGITWTASNGGFDSPGPGGGLGGLGFGTRVIYGNGYFLVQYQAGSIDKSSFGYASANANFDYRNVNHFTGPVYPIDGRNNTPTFSKIHTYQNGFYIFLSAYGKLSYANSSNVFGRGFASAFVSSTPSTEPAVSKPMIYNNGTFVIASGRHNDIYTSNTGTSWNTLKPDIYGASPIEYVNGRYIMSGYGVLTSTNLINWTGRVSTAISTPSQSTLLYGNGIYWSIPTETFFEYVTTQNVNSYFDSRSSTEFPRVIGTANTILSGAYGIGTYVIAGANGKIYYLTSNVTWISGTSGTTSTINAVTYGNGIFTYAGNGGVLRTSTNGIAWDARTSGTTSIIRALTYGNGVYVYAGDGGVLATSTDSITWTARTSGTTSILRGLTYGNGLYVYGGDGGVLRTSTDGITWNSVTSGTTSAIFTLMYGNGLYVYGGAGGALSTSTNGSTWTARSSLTTSSILSMMYGNGVYFYNAQRQLWNSNNAITWYPYNANTGDTHQPIISTTYGNGVYCCWMQNGQVVTTTDFNSWDKYTPVSNATMYDCAYGNGYFVAVGETTGQTGFGFFLVSQNANTASWRYTQTHPNQAYFSVNYRNGLFTLVGTHGVSGSNTYVATCNTHVKNPLLTNSWSTLITGSTLTNSVIIYGNNEYVMYSTNNRVESATNVERINFAPGYDATTNFFIPNLTGVGTFSTVTTTASQPRQRVFVKAKNV